MAATPPGSKDVLVQQLWLRTNWTFTELLERLRNRQGAPNARVAHLRQQLESGSLPSPIEVRATLESLFPHSDVPERELSQILSRFAALLEDLALPDNASSTPHPPEPMQWDDSLTTGVPRIDEQHRTVLAAAAELHQALAVGETRDVIAFLFDRLVLHLLLHFREEEAILRQAGSAQLDEHVARHEELVTELDQLRRLSWERRSQALLEFLSTWLPADIREDQTLPRK